MCWKNKHIPFPFTHPLFYGPYVQMPRTQRFPESFHQALQSLVLSIMPHITIRYLEIPEEARCINISLANFIKVSLTDTEKSLGRWAHGFSQSLRLISWMGQAFLWTVSVVLSILDKWHCFVECLKWVDLKCEYLSLQNSTKKSRL